MDASAEIDPLDRVALILQFSDRWFLHAALLFVIVVGGAGWGFFSHNGTLAWPDWAGAWGLLVVASALNLRLAPQLAMLEGSGEVGGVARLRLVQSIFGNVAMWALLFCGMKLWSLALLPTITALFTYTWLRQHSFIRELNVRRANGISCLMDWRKEIFPLQWRIALSWASGYLIFQAITPIAFAKLGTVAAGQIGLAFAIFNGVQSLGMSWMYTRIPRFAELVARNDRKSLNAAFISSLKRTLGAVSVGTGLVVIGVGVLIALKSGLVSRIPDVLSMICFGVTTIVNCVIFSMALYMRSHKEEPMLLSSMVGGVLVLIGVYFGASYSVFVTALIYMLINVCVGLPWAWLLFRRYYYYGKTQHGW